MSKKVETPINKVEPESIKEAMGKKVYTEQEFANEYLELCKKTGFQISGQAVLKPMNDLGGSLIAIQLVVIPYQEPRK
jgi:hypothetical protein